MQGPGFEPQTPQKKIINSKFYTIFCQTTFNLKITLELKKKKKNQTALAFFLKSFILTLF